MHTYLEVCDHCLVEASGCLHSCALPWWHCCQERYASLSCAPKHWHSTPVLCLWSWVLSWCLLCSQRPRFLNCKQCWRSRWSSVQLVCMLCLCTARNLQMLPKHPWRVVLRLHLVYHTHHIPYYFRWHHKLSRFPLAAVLNGGCCHAPLVSISTTGRALILRLTASFEGHSSCRWKRCLFMTPQLERGRSEFQPPHLLTEC